LGFEGIREISKALIKNKKLKVLDISNNKLQDDSALLLRDMLAENVYLRELYVNLNRITSAGGYEIFDSLFTNQTLAVLDISYNLLQTVKPYI